METFTRFLYEFLNQFFSGFIGMFKGIGEGFAQAFNFKRYQEILNNYKGDLSMPEWLLVGISIALIIIFIAAIILLIYFLFRKYFKFRKTNIEKKEGKCNGELRQSVFKSAAVQRATL